MHRLYNEKAPKVYYIQKKPYICPDNSNQTLSNDRINIFSI